MPRKKIKVRAILIVSLVFIVYFFMVARPVPRETILTAKWINSFETQDPIYLNTAGKTDPAGSELLPFTLGYHFGYVDTSGNFAVNRIRNSDIDLGKNMWTEYPPEPSDIEIKNIAGETIINIENTRGYPVLLDNRIFILGSEQNSLSEIDTGGNVKWTYEFGSILTDMDVAAGLVVAVSLDGVVKILDSQGKRIHIFQPGGSRLEAIYGCAISRNGARIGIIAGYDPQRFLLLERFGTEEGEYRVVYHEFLDRGYRRPVHIQFVDEDRRVVFERQGGVNCYSIRSRRCIFVPLDGELAAIDKSGDSGMLFLITRHMYQPMQKELIGIRLPKDRGFSGLQNKNAVFLKAPYKSEDIYLGRTQTAKGQSMLIVGGGAALISFNLEKK
ncbi:MAG: PQQ-like beta-propeller repeat protein [Treponema sp.]|jgi:hypothetical protein|nr:PQQ-like beta-propeller repeat protein [Treponema sp.]